MKAIHASKSLFFISLLCLLWLPNYCDNKQNAADDKDLETDKVISSDSSRIENVPAKQEKEIFQEILTNEKPDVKSNVEYVNIVGNQENEEVDPISFQKDEFIQNNENVIEDGGDKEVESIEITQEKVLLTNKNVEIVGSTPTPDLSLTSVVSPPGLSSVEPSSPESSLSKQVLEKKRLVGPSLHSAAVEALARSTAMRAEEAASRSPHPIPRRPVTERPTTDEHHQPHYDGMPSFDEWKKMMLAEQQKGGQKVPSPSLPGKKISSQKRRRNYSSFECGAKIVAANAEAEGTGRILNELVDEYLLNPCKAKIWFVIELCETVQANQIELANFELFSSAPKDFAVYSSDNFPTRDWVQLGTFSAAEQRVLQSFELKQEGFGKFIKIELLSYYGKEHYCPLSVVRIFGTSMVDEYEEMETLASHPEISDDDLDRLDIVLEDKKPTNLFGSATDAVLNIVKKAAQALGQHQPSEDKKNDTFIEKQNISKIKACKVLDDSSQECDASVITKEPPMLPNISSLPSSMHHSLFRLLRRCDQCASSRIRYYSSAQPHCRFFQAVFGPVVFQSLCDWFREHPLVFAHETPTHRNKPDPLYDNSLQIPTKSPPPQIIILPPDSDASASSSGNLSVEASVETDSINATRTLSDYNDSIESDFMLEPSIQSTHTQQETYTISLNESRSIVSDTVSEESTILSDSIIQELPEAPVIMVTDESNLSIVDSILEPVSTDVGATDLPAMEVFTEADEEQMAEFLLDPIAVAPEDIQDQEVITTELLKGSEDARSETIGKLEPAAVTSTGQKESVFMRMSNRIKALELNMSLSSQYLQELSQRYRRQMEDMQRAFNRTIGALNDTAKKAAEKDLKQQEILNTLQLQVSNLSETIDILLNERSSLLRQMVETHVCLMFIEAIIMITVMSLCVRRISSRDTDPPVVRPTTRDNRPSTLSSPRLSKRRSSVDSCASPIAPKVKKRSASEEALNSDEGVLIVEPLPIYVDPILKAKKKNRRRSKVQRSISNPSVQRRNSSPPLNQHRPDKRVSYSDGCMLKHSKSSHQLQRKAHACENCNDNTCARTKISDRERKMNGTPFQNLTNGTISNIQDQHTVKDSKFEKGRERFSFKKFLRFQKRDSI